ncbi:MAG: hypothetical protein MJ171_05505 [Clostridia bacterium]|nr:hypothetical protein [Clostridia bacterium]
MREIVFCPKCDFTGSLESGAALPRCPGCSSKLVRSYISKKEWDSFPDDLKEQTRAEVIAGDEGREIETRNNVVETYLEEIEKHTRATRNWVTFIGIVVLITVTAKILFVTFNAAAIMKFVRSMSQLFGISLPF